MQDDLAWYGQRSHWDIAKKGGSGVDLTSISVMLVCDKAIWKMKSFLFEFNDIWKEKLLFVKHSMYADMSI